MLIYLDNLSNEIVILLHSNVIDFSVFLTEKMDGEKKITIFFHVFLCIPGQFKNFFKFYYSYFYLARHFFSKILIFDPKHQIKKH